jgi:hypothetical protein
LIHKIHGLGCPGGIRQLKKPVAAGAVLEAPLKLAQATGVEEFHWPLFVALSVQVASAANTECAAKQPRMMVVMQAWERNGLEMRGFMGLDCGCWFS